MSAADLNPGANGAGASGAGASGAGASGAAGAAAGSGACTEVAPGVLRLQEPDGPRFICQFVVRGDDATLIVDAGLPGSAQRNILPALDPAQQHLLLITHPDTDHCGGTSELVAALPGLEVIAHEADADALGDPDRTIERRYRRFAADGVEPDDRALARLRGRLGGPFAIDRAVADGHELDLAGRRCRLVHLPGHSAGHAGVWLPEVRVLIAADAAMGHGIRKLDGDLLYAPQFLSPSIYRATLERIAELQPAMLLCTHEPVLEGPAIEAFLEASREAVDALEAHVDAALRAGARTLPEVCAAVHRGHAGLPDGRPGDLVMSVAGILAAMVTTGRAHVERTSVGRAWRPAA
jgi:glyoxylase-like metal-dependent hydrolase (beta-lactamase superfamily II)